MITEKVHKLSAFKLENIVGISITPYFILVPLGLPDKYIII